MKEELLIYSTIENNLPTETPEASFIPDIQDAIKGADALTVDMIYAIMKKYQLSENPDATDLPYGSKFLKKGLKIDLAALPPRLLCMIHTFLTKYYKRED